MAHLTLAGLSDDGKRVLLVSDKGVEFTLDVDERLRAALRGDHARLGQLEIKMDSALRPRDIQSRIRAGETPESVAQAARTTVEAIMPFAAPVLAERQHVAGRAQRSSVRRSAASGGARTLGDAVAGHLRGLNVDPDTVDWDAARREDGRWTVTGAFNASGRSGIARFVFDAPGNYSTVDNDEATWLVGDAPAAAAGAGAAAAAPAVGDDISRARARRAAATSPGEDTLPLGDDAISLVSDSSDAADSSDSADSSDDSLGSEQPVEGYLDDPAPEREPEPADLDDTDEEPAEEPARDERDEPAGRKPAKRRGRASVPSWDEIMFGGSGKE